MSDSRQTSLSLYQYLCRHVVGTEDTVRTKRIWNTLYDNCTYYDSFAQIMSGSFGKGLEMKGSDLDTMLVSKDVVVFEEITDIQSDPDKGAYFQIITDDTKPGFVKLLHISSTNKSYIDHVDLCEKIGSEFYLSNVIFKAFFSNIMTITGGTTNDKIHGPCLSDKDGLYDTAFCLHSSSWITQANQWISRSHITWPSNDIKSQIIEHGVLFVPIGVKGSPNEDIQWRISFSVGEKLLIYTFTHTQLLCYALMKIVLKDLINTDPECEDLLCSYFIKNIMFWLSEELPLSLWRPDNLVPCFMQGLERLIYCVEYSVCVHYFIPENNMFENRIEGEKRRVLLDKLRVLYSFEWRCILLSPQLQNCWLGLLNFEAHLFDVHFEQIVCSKVMLTPALPKSVSHVFRWLQTYKSPLIRSSIMRRLSLLCNREAQSVHLFSKYSNKKLYRQYKTCQCYLMPSLYRDIASGWLLVASMFYRMKQYRKALDILFYTLDKCSPEKVSYGIKFTEIQRSLLKSKTITDMDLGKALKIFYVSKLEFIENSLLIPNELETEITNTLYFVPPVVYGHFLSFLCHYHLHDIRQCRTSIRDIILTIDQQYFIHNKFDKAVAYNCLGVAYQLIGDVELARRAFLNSIQFDTKFNTALQRLSMLESTQ